MKKCKCCEQLKPADHFYKNHRLKDGLSIYCKECNDMKTKQYMKNNKDKVAKYFRTKYNRHKVKVKAQLTLRKAVSDNLINKPEYCEVCKKSFEKDKIHGHHYDYNKPLNVVWCCSSCHKQIHKTLDKQK